MPLNGDVKSEKETTSWMMSAAAGRATGGAVRDDRVPAIHDMHEE